MKFIEKQPDEKISEYIDYLKIFSLLSKLFSESKSPYLHYRIVENLFCQVFEAENLSRNDSAIDARKQNLGIGLKTFLEMSADSYQKIAEFDFDLRSYKNDDKEIMIRKISDIRNKRIRLAKRLYGLNEMIYHCVTRSSDRVKIFEPRMHEINVNKIRIEKIKCNSIIFSDSDFSYSFNIPKSTLFAKFSIPRKNISFKVKILNNPFPEIYQRLKGLTAQQDLQTTQSIYLPLFSEKENRPYIPEKSGLNQWNASGRTRDYDEIYIRISAFVNKQYSSFFPAREQKFNLILPNGKILSSKICQQDNKALMSDPNKNLGKWMLRQVLELKKGQLLTYQYLCEMGIDSVRISKLSENDYKIDFAPIGSYENFKAGYFNEKI